MRVARRITREEEAELIRKAQAGSKRARNKLIHAHYGFLVHLASQHHGQAAMPDMIQNAVLGLIDAIYRDDPNRPTRLLTHGYWPIKRGILQAIADASLFHRRGIKSTGMRWLIRQSLDSDAPENAKRLLSLDTLSPSEDNEPITLGETIRDDSVADPVESVAKQEILDRTKQRFERALGKRDQKVVKMRVLAGPPPMSFREIGQKLGISKERARKLFNRAMKKLREDTGIMDDRDDE